MEPLLTLTDAPTAAQEQVISSGLGGFNKEKAGKTGSAQRFEGSSGIAAAR